MTLRKHTGASAMSCRKCHWPEPRSAISGTSLIANPFLNAGRGAPGWTLFRGCAKLWSDVIFGKNPEIALEGLTLAH